MVIYRFFFTKWRLFAVFDPSDVHWNHPRRVIGGLCIVVQNLVGVDADAVVSTIGLYECLIFCAFGLKTPIHAPKIGGCGDLTP